MSGPSSAHVMQQPPQWRLLHNTEFFVNTTGARRQNSRAVMAVVSNEQNSPTAARTSHPESTRGPKPPCDNFVIDRSARCGRMRAGGGLISAGYPLRRRRLAI